MSVFSIDRKPFLSSALLALLVGLWLCGCPGDEEEVAEDATDPISDQTDAGEPDEQEAVEEPDMVTGPAIGPTTQSDCLMPEPEVGPTVQEGCIQPPPDEITVGETIQTDCLGGPGPYITATDQSECRDEPAIGPTTVEPCEGPGEPQPDSFRVVPGPARIHLVHVNATHNCCGLIEMQLAVSGTTLIVTEEEIFDEEHPACFCLCEFGLSADITGLVGGDYTVRFVDGATGEPYTEDIPVTVPGVQPAFRAEGGPGIIKLWHDASEHSCCVDVAMQFALDGTSVTVWEVESGPPCDCICYFDLSATIKGLQAGTYSVQLLDGPGGSPVGDPVSVTVTEGEAEIWAEVAEDRLTVYHHGAVWNCCGDVTMNVSLDEENSLILVEEVETAGTAGYPCRCVCAYDLQVEASGFPRGDYTVRLFTNHGGEYRVFGEVEVYIPGRPGPGEPTEEVSAQAAGDFTIVVTHTGAIYNCCSEVDMTATLSDSLLEVEEVITNDELCFCVCDFTLYAPISRLAPGEYTVHVTSADGTEVGSDTVTVVGEGVPPWPPDEVILERSGSTLDITHRGIEYMCCSEVAFQLEVEGHTLDVIEVITNPETACFCTCRYELAAVITGLEPDEDYTIRVWTEDRTALLHQEEVEAD